MKLQSIYQQGGGWPAWPGFYDFPPDSCINLIRLVPAEHEIRHISDVIRAEAYINNELEWDELAPDAPATSKSATEENYFGDRGSIAIIYSALRNPQLKWTLEVSRLHPTLVISHDYSWDGEGLMGRVLYSEGRVTAACHIKAFPEALSPSAGM